MDLLDVATPPCSGLWLIVFIYLLLTKSFCFRFSSTFSWFQRSEKGQLVSDMANPLRGQVFKLYKTVSEQVGDTHTRGAGVSRAANGLNVFFSSPESCCILAVSTPRAQPTSESGWSLLSWRIKTWRTLRRSDSWWPVATLSSRSWRLCISSGNIGPWRRGITIQRNNCTHSQHQITLLKGNTGCVESTCVNIWFISSCPYIKRK